MALGFSATSLVAPVPLSPQTVPSRHTWALGLGVVLLLASVVAPGCRSETCWRGETRCDANQIEVCVYDNEFDRNYWEWTERCGDGVCIESDDGQYCALTEDPDPRCSAAPCADNTVLVCKEGRIIYEHNCETDSGYAYRADYTWDSSPGICVVPDDRGPLCALSTEPDPLCARVGKDMRCEGSNLVVCDGVYLRQIFPCPETCVDDLGLSGARCALGTEPVAQCQEGPGAFCQDGLLMDCFGDWLYKVESCVDSVCTKDDSAVFCERSEGGGGESQLVRDAFAELPVNADCVIRVAALTGEDSQTGGSFTQALRTLQHGLDRALAWSRRGSCSEVEIWVAEGTYTPSLVTDADDPRTATFRLAEGVALYGGFAGTETAREERDPNAHPTVLSGDLGEPGDSSDNALVVVTGANGAILDGFTVTGASAGSDVGAMVNDGVSPTVNHCVFSHNLGPGMLNRAASPHVTRCSFENNQETGLSNFDQSAPRIEDCSFEGNVTTTDGGGILNYGGSAPR